jgi:hypothetical protein
MLTKNKTRSARPASAYPAGMRLRCDVCGAEIDIVSPCICEPPNQVFRCCGEDMIPYLRWTPQVGVD